MIRSFQGIQLIIDPTAFVAETAVIIGNIETGPQSNIWYNCVARGDINHIRIGARSNVQDLSMRTSPTKNTLTTPVRGHWSRKGRSSRRTHSGSATRPNTSET